MPVVRHEDPFSATLLSSEVLPVTLEQRVLIKKVLDKACSDSRFSDKAYVAIDKILTGGAVVPPVVTSLNPGSATVGDPSFTLHVLGSGFTPGSIIVFNGGEEVTAFVSDTELTTEVDMSTVTVASAVPVAVLNVDGVLSDAQSFVFQDAVSFAALKLEKEKEEAEKKAAARKIAEAREEREKNEREKK